MKLSAFHPYLGCLLLGTTITATAQTSDDENSESEPESVARPKQVDGISLGRYIAGGAVGTVMGFGVGHAVSGVYRKSGWIFSVTEGAAIMVTSVGAVRLIINGSSCLSTALEKLNDEAKNQNKNKTKCSQGDLNDDTNMIVYSMYAFVGLRIWETIDIWLRPKIARSEKANVDETGTHSAIIMPVLNWPRLVGVRLTVPL